MHMSMGQEAIPVAFCHALGLNDQVYGTFRCHAEFLAKTQNTDIFFAELYGKVTGTACGKGGSMHLSFPEKGFILSSAIVGSCLPVAVGNSFANKQKGNRLVTCVFFGDGAMEEGVFWECVNVAGLMQLPIIFVCENNGLAVHTKLDVRQGFKDIKQVISNFDFQVHQIETSDVEEIFKTANEAIQLTRKESKPAFFEIKCFRYLEHVGISEDFSAGYRSRKDFEEWKKLDSISLQRKRLLQLGVSESELEEIERKINLSIEQSVALARSAPFSDANELLRGVFYEKN